MLRYSLLLTLSIVLTAKGQSVSTEKRENPFFSASPLQYQAPPFDKIRDADFLPAFEKGMQEQIDEIEKIANNPEPPTFDNTLVALERSGELLIRVENVFHALTMANTNDTLQKTQEVVAPKEAAHYDAIYLNPKLFARVQKIYSKRDRLNAEDKFLTERYYQAFVRSGILLSDSDKIKLRKLNMSISSLETKFRSKLLAGTKTAALIVKEKSQLAGLSEPELSAAALAARERGLKEAWVITLQNTTQQPALSELTDRKTREQLFKASIYRTEQPNEQAPPLNKEASQIVKKNPPVNSDDVRNTIQQLAMLRLEKAKLLGYPSFSAYVLEDELAKTPQRATQMLEKIGPSALQKAKSEAKKLEASADIENPDLKLMPWDWDFYSEKLRQQEYDLDEAKIKPYFELNRVLQDGLFFSANKLYGLTFKERKDIPVYHPDVRVFEVFDADGKSIALWYADYYQRDNKTGGAWMDYFVTGNELLKSKPVLFNVCNFNKPDPGQPTLLSFDEVNTMFHEFGHALYGFFVQSKYPLFVVNLSRDFVEFPSQFNEHWASDPVVFANYAKHYQTGKAMPKELVEKIMATQTFNQGYATTEALKSALLDMGWHTLSKPLKDVDLQKFETEVFKRFNVDFDLVPPRYHSSYFNHIWSGEYAGRYYSYLWSEMISDDAAAWFVEHGGLKRKNGERFRKLLLSKGRSPDFNALYRHFRGRDPSIDALLQRRGLE